MLFDILITPAEKKYVHAHRDVRSVEQRNTLIGSIILTIPGSGCDFEIANKPGLLKESLNALTVARPTSSPSAKFFIQQKRKNITSQIPKPMNTSTEVSMK
jgi:hypothetical protein